MLSIPEFLFNVENEYLLAVALEIQSDDLYDHLYLENWLVSFSGELMIHHISTPAAFSIMKFFLTIDQKCF